MIKVSGILVVSVFGYPIVGAIIIIIGVYIANMNTANAWELVCV